MDEGLLRKAVDTAWSIYLANHRGADATDSRRCLLERHLDRTWGTHESDVEELTCSGIAFLERLPEDDT